MQAFKLRNREDHLGVKTMQRTKEEIMGCELVFVFSHAVVKGVLLSFGRY